MAAKKGDLTERQRRFVEEYLVDGNATQAATRAGYSPATARQQGQRMLTNVDIKAALKAAQGQRSERIGVTQDRVVEELALVGFSDLRHYKVTGGGLMLAEHAPSEAMRAVSSVKQTMKLDQETGDLVTNVEYKFWDKNSALEKLAKHLGMFVERHEVSVVDVRGRVSRTLEVVRRHVDAPTFTKIVADLRPVWR